MELTVELPFTQALPGRLMGVPAELFSSWPQLGRLTLARELCTAGHTLNFGRLLLSRDGV